MSDYIDPEGVPAAVPEAAGRFLAEILGVGTVEPVGPDGDMFNLSVGQPVLTFVAAPVRDGHHIAFRVDEPLSPPQLIVGNSLPTPVGGRGLSGFVARAVDHELERDALARYLGDLNAEFGPVAAELVEAYNALWP